MNDIRENENSEPQVGIRDTDGMDRWHRNEEERPSRGGQPGNNNALKHGIFADRFLTEDERPIFEAIIAQLHEDFVFNKSSDFMQVELVAVYFLKLGRAQVEGNWDAAERLDRMIRCHLKDLKTTKIVREGEEPKGAETTPAEWATSLLERLAEVESKARAESEPEKTQE